MSKQIAYSTLWWLAQSSINQLTHAYQNETDTSNSYEEFSTGEIVAITIGALAAVAITALIVAGKLSCATTKTTEQIHTNPDGSGTFTRTHERGSNEVASKMVEIAGKAIEGMKEISSEFPHTSITLTSAKNNNPSTIPASPATSPNSTSQATTVQKATIIAASTTSSVQSAEGYDEQVWTAEIKLYTDQVILDQAMLEDAKRHLAQYKQLKQSVSPIDLHDTSLHVEIAGETSDAHAPQTIHC